MHSMNYEDVKNDVNNTLSSVQEQLTSGDFSKNTKEELESQAKLYEYVNDITEMNHLYQNGY
ncbi:hypothetical protein [Bacillus sp. OAE603]|uniref:hypothetical protein n=1 Tax=Gottfriedia sp. OAE603 TaxID=2663872 RepID=UPI00178B3B16